jgi:hypothetical protein
MIRRFMMVLSVALCMPLAGLAQQATDGTGGNLRVLDKVTGEVSDISLRSGQTQQLGYLRVKLDACRYPVSNPSGDAYAAISVWYREAATPIFEGWIIASSPALYAMDHPRYDIWALRCTTS